MSEKSCDNCKWIEQAVDEYPCSHCHPYTRNKWQSAEPDTCEWTRFRTGHKDRYDTECGRSANFDVLDLNDEPDFKFCPFCGREIKVKEEEDAG